jgi:3-oxoacyl-[acyl-carrier protein] reductase
MTKVALVTGGSRGIGRATCIALADRGVRVAVNYVRDAESAKATHEALSGDGHFLVQGDISDPGAVQAMVQRVIDECGQLDILVNNAATYPSTDVSTSEYENWQQSWTDALSVNLLGTANATYCTIKRMSGGGRIVNLGSLGSQRGDADHLAYAAAKAGAKAMAQSLATAVAQQNIFIGTVTPGFVDTDMAAPLLEGDLREQVEQKNPIGRIARPEEVATTIVFLALDAPFAMTGCVVDVNGSEWLRP